MKPRSSPRFSSREAVVYNKVNKCIISFIILFQQILTNFCSELIRFNNCHVLNFPNRAFNTLKIKGIYKIKGKFITLRTLRCHQAACEGG